MKISVDSRTVLIPSETEFYALKGKNHDGHDYIEGLYSKGVRHFVASEHRPQFDKMEGASVFYCDDTLKELQDRAARYRQECRAVVAGITGSNGKTVVKEWIAQLLGGDIALGRSPRSYNSQVGVPLSLFGIGANDSLALIEAGISMPGEMARLERMIRPQVGIFTHFGDAHGENFSSADEKFREKALLFKRCGTVICRDGETAAGLGECLPGQVSIVKWGESAGADIRILASAMDSSGRDIRISSSFFEGERILKLPFCDEASFENCMTAVTFLLWYGCSIDILAERVPDLQPVAMRMEIKEGVNGCTLIRDYYNSDPASFALAVEALSRQEPSKSRTVILSDFVDAGGDPSGLYSEVAAVLKRYGVDCFVGVGEQLCRHRDLFSGIRSRFYVDTDSFVRQEEKKDYSESAVLIKGARKFRFEYIGNFLQKQSHTTSLEVDLDAMGRNLAYFRSLVPSRTRIAVMVKAFSYGSGSVEVASFLQYNGVDYLMVAFADEGVELRSHGITVPIAVMNPEPETLDTIIEFSLEPQIYSIDMLWRFEHALLRHGAGEYPVHVKLNTGMNRSGLDEADLPGLEEFFRTPRSCTVASVFSHLAASDDPAEDGFTLGQICKFTSMSDRIRGFLGYPFLRHILNSAGIERFPEYSFDMVRLGIGLHGISAVTELEPVSTFRTHIASVRTLHAGDTVGYVRMGRITRESRIAVIPVGYADGMDRRMGCGTGRIYVNGTEVPVTGNVCMDACMIDITDTDAGVGDEVEIFGKHIRVEEAASRIGTIPYEVLTGVSRRVRRVYYKE